MRRSEESAVPSALEEPAHTERNPESLLRTLAVRNAELEGMLRMKNRIVGMVAHDLRNPITAIKGFTELLIKVGNFDKDSVSILREIQLSVELMDRLAHDVLDYATTENGALHFRVMPCALSPLLDGVCRVNAFLARNKNIQIRLACEGALGVVMLDQHRIVQVLNNLISNAVKFSRHDSEVEIVARRDDAWFEVRVRDHGTGIAQETQHGLFQPYGVGGSPGTDGEPHTGLGLYISRRIVEGHGGTITLESTPGTGSTFYIRLPCEPRP